MERKIGEIFEYNGEWYQCIRSILTCSSCEIPRPCTKIRELGYCSPNMRNDKEQVVFKKLEKVGEPFSCDYYGDSPIMMQEYNLYNLDDVTNEDNIPMYITDYRHKRVAIEIKQTKEDMEGKTNLYEKQTPLQKLMEIYCDGRMDYNEFEKKVKELYSDKGDDSKPNLKPFDLGAAKQGKPVCTRDGRKARIICFDRNGKQPIIALVAQDNEELIENYHLNGRFNVDAAFENNNDLMMLSEKKEEWVNVYKDSVYDTKEEALNRRSEFRGYIDTVKVSWEE